MQPMTAKQVMTPNPFMIRPTLTIKEAAQRMKQMECGVLPVGEPDNVVGILTDRDIAIRVVAEGLLPAQVTAEEVMSTQVYSCDEADDITDVAEQMRTQKVARLVVKKGEKVTGIVTMKCLLQSNGNVNKSSEVLEALVGSLTAEKSGEAPMATAAGASESYEK